jgi:hypothetical protein
MQIVGADWGKEFIAKAKLQYSSKNILFSVENFEDLSFPNNSFDCVYADNVIEHSYNVDNVLREIHRVLRPEGILVAALPSDARNVEKICVSHTWKTAPHEVRMRLENAGFYNINIAEIDTYLQLGMPPYPPSTDKMIYLSARKYKSPASPLHRAINSMNWIYKNLSPEPTASSFDPVEIIAKGSACGSEYAFILGCLLRKEAFDISWLSMTASDHPMGCGSRKKVSHEVIQLSLNNGTKVILDPMCNVYFENSIEELIQNPELSNIKRNEDSRYLDKNYHLYSSSKWYEKVTKYSFRSNFHDKS